MGRRGERRGSDYDIINIYFQGKFWDRRGMNEKCIKKKRYRRMN